MFLTDSLFFITKWFNTYTMWITVDCPILLPCFKFILYTITRSMRRVDCELSGLQSFSVRTSNIGSCFITSISFKSLRYRTLTTWRQLSLLTMSGEFSNWSRTSLLFEWRSSPCPLITSNNNSLTPETYSSLLGLFSPYSIIGSSIILIDSLLNESLRNT